MKVITLDNLGTSFVSAGGKIEAQRVFSPIATKSANYSLVAEDETIVMLAAGTKATLPASIAKKKIVIKNGSSGSISITGHIDGIVSTMILTRFDCRTFHGDGTTWWII